MSERAAAGAATDGHSPRRMPARVGTLRPRPLPPTRECRDPNRLNRRPPRQSSRESVHRPLRQRGAAATARRRDGDRRRAGASPPASAPLRRVASLRRLARCRRRHPRRRDAAERSRPPAAMPPAPPAPCAGRSRRAECAGTGGARRAGECEEGRPGLRRKPRLRARRSRRQGTRDAALPARARRRQLAMSARRLPPSTSLTRSPSCTAGWLE